MTTYDYHYDLNDLFICREFILYEKGTVPSGPCDSINALHTTYLTIRVLVFFLEVNLGCLQGITLL